MFFRRLGELNEILREDDAGIQYDASALAQAGIVHPHPGKFLLECLRHAGRALAGRLTPPEGAPIPPFPEPRSDDKLSLLELREWATEIETWLRGWAVVDVAFDGTQGRLRATRLKLLADQLGHFARVVHRVEESEFVMAAEEWLALLSMSWFLAERFLRGSMAL
jgi:hypothetical protein